MDPGMGWDGMAGGNSAVASAGYRDVTCLPLGNTRRKKRTTRFILLCLVVCACLWFSVCGWFAICDIRYTICGMRYAVLCGVSGVGLGEVWLGRMDRRTNGRTDGRMNASDGRARAKKPKAESRYPRTQPQPLLLLFFFFLPLALAKGRRDEAMRQ
ncbi:hypothetical protein V8E52_004611 [Russula decolorans]